MGRKNKDQRKVRKEAQPSSALEERWRTQLGQPSAEKIDEGLERNQGKPAWEVGGKRPATKPVALLVPPKAKPEPSVIVEKKRKPSRSRSAEAQARRREKREAHLKETLGADYIPRHERLIQQPPD